jgi:ketosteroid isomerase-like protein
MKRVAAASLLYAFTLIAAPLYGQTAPQSGLQTGVQTGPLQTAAPQSPDASQKGIKPSHTLIPIPMPLITPGQMELLKLESEFSEAVTKEGGKAFASRFADDGVTLNNGRAPVQGIRAITKSAQWDPKTYQLSWFVEGAQMGPSNDTGFTWGHYDATTVDPATGKSSTASGRYITFWKKVDGKWKVALDASADEPPPPPGTPGSMSLPAATPPR